MTPIPEQPHHIVLPEGAALGGPVIMPSDEQLVDWIYAADAAEAWYGGLTMEHPPHGVYDLCSEQRCIEDMTAHLRKLLPEVKISVGSDPASN